MNYPVVKGKTGLSAVLMAACVAFGLVAGLLSPLEAGANTTATVSYKADFVEQDIHWSSNDHTHDCINTEHSLSAAESDCDELGSWTDSAYVCGYYCQNVTYTHVPNPPWNYIGGNPPTNNSPPGWSEQDMYCAQGATCSSQPISQWPSEWTMYVYERCSEGGVLGWMMNDNFGNEFKDFCLVSTTNPDPTGACGPNSQQDPATHECYNFFARSGGTPPPSQSGGDPFDMGSGNMFQEVVDYKGGGAFPLVLKRTYNSALANQASSLSNANQNMGPGWTSTLGGAHLYITLAPPPMVICTDDGSGYPSGAVNDPYYGKPFACPTDPNGNVQGSVTVWHADGSQAIFTGMFSLGTWYPATSTEALVPEPGSTGEMSWIWNASTNTGTYVYQRADGYTETYDKLGRLITVQDPTGLQQNYGYVGYRVLTVTDHTGRVMSVAYDANGRVQTVTVPSQAATTGTATITYSYNATTGNLMSATYKDNNTSPAYSSTINYEYNDSVLTHAMTGIQDENGSEYAAWSYNDSSMKAICSEQAPSANLPSTATTCVTDTGGVDKVMIAYNSDGSADVTEATGLVRHLTFSNVNGRMLLTSASVRCTDCGDSSHTISYDTNGDGYVAQTTDFAGNISTYQHDSATGLELSRIVGQNSDPTKNVSRSVTTTWCGPQSVNGNGCIMPLYAVNTVTESGRTTTYSYYPSGQAQTQTVTDTASGQSRTTRYAYYPSGLLETVTDPRGNITTYTYTNNNTGDLYTTTNALQQTVTINSYTASGLPLSITDVANNVVTQLSYDARGHVASRTVAGATTSYLHNPDETLHSIVMPATTSGQTQMTYGYDHGHRLTSVSDNLGDTVAYTLDAYGNRTEEDTCASAANCQPGSLADLRVHIRKYNALNELTDEIGGMGQDTVYSNQDGNGNAQTITDPMGHPTTVGFDALNRINQVTDAESGNTNFIYDPLNRLQYLTDPKGLSTQYARDAFGEITQLISPDTGTASYDYSAWVSAATVTKTDARGVVSIYGYDPLYRIKTVTYPSDAARNVTYTYDQCTYGAGRLCQMTDGSGTTAYAYDAHGNVTSKTATLDGHVFTVGYQYDAADKLTDMTYPSGLHVHYGRDATERVNEVDANSAPVVSGVSYEPFGPITGLTYGNTLTESRSYDLDYRVDTVNVQGVLSLSLLPNNCGTGATSGYDADNNILSITDELNGSNTQCFGYDSMNRLTLASGAYGSQAYAYDTVNVLDGYDGNRTQETLNGTATSLTYDTASNKLLTVGAQSYSYDATGNLLSDGGHSYNYDAAGRLRGFDASTIAYVYNGLGQRVIKFPDVTPPSVTIAGPANGAYVTGSVGLTASASASDSVSVVSVQYQLDAGNLGGTLGSSPYGLSWDTTKASDGIHSLTAIATDAAGNTGTSAALTVTVDNTPPSVGITAPSNPNVSGTTTLSASATDSFGVASVWFQLDGVTIPGSLQTTPASGSTYSYAWVTTTATTGSHALTAVAKDHAGNTTTSAAVTVIVPDTTPPAVNIAAPPGGTSVVGGTSVSLTATATDDSDVQSVQFYLDGTTFGALQTASPAASTYAPSITWDTTSYSSGTHTFTAVVTDTAGNTATSAPLVMTVTRAIATLTPSYPSEAQSYQFPNTAATHSSAAKNFTLKNTGTAPLYLSSSFLTHTGPNPYQFTVTNVNCPTTGAAVPPNGCTISVVFNPSSYGSFADGFLVNPNGQGVASVSDHYAGTGTINNVVLSPASHDFGDVPLSRTASYAFTVKNNNGISVHISSGVGGGVIFSISNTTCAGSGWLGSGASCTITVNFAPIGDRAYSAALNVTTDGAGTVQGSVTGTGTGVAP